MTGHLDELTPIDLHDEPTRLDLLVLDPGEGQGKSPHPEIHHSEAAGMLPAQVRQTVSL